ncbi:putative cell wall-associated hydrolase [Bacillus phage pW2]|uniref:Protein OPG091 n=1 Tax=Bacillus phage pW2 TaxID=2500559 RepID=A0A3Q9R7J7_9CAUD|nr:enoyl-CoA hydratase/carnithine racemase-like [Bacillus phage pW2]AZU98923.1 putative cell wall-associated hydrolase [Bacillus phage pW2]
MIGNLVFFKEANSFISRLIAKVTKSEFTHVGLIVEHDETTGIVTIIESNRFIRTRVKRLQLNERHVIYTIGNQPQEVVDNIVKFAYKNLGRRYDYLQILGLFISLSFRRERNIYFNSKNKLICSELVDLAYYTSGVKRKTNQNLGNITPQELLEVYDLKEL